LAIEIRVEVADIAKFRADVLALKYARELYGVDRYIGKFLTEAGVPGETLTPLLDDYRFTGSNRAIAADSVLILGVKGLSEFRYQEIRRFARGVLVTLKRVAPDTQHVCMTLHGANFGLDEVEAFQSEIAGLLEAVQDGEFPPSLQRISVVEINLPRAERLDTILSELLPGKLLSATPNLAGLSSAARQKLRSVGYASEGRPHVFVAMSFAEDFNDTFSYGIQGAVRNAGFICERADLAAWGCEVPTVLLAKNSDDLKLNVRGQRCIIYRNIKDLEEKLTRELTMLSEGVGE
jgi:hypothetical protein